MASKHATGVAVVEWKETATDVGVMRPAVQQPLLGVHEDVREEEELAFVRPTPAL